MSEYWTQRVREVTGGLADFSPKYMLPDDYLSASSIFEYWTCPRLFEFRRIKGIPSPKTAALVGGSAVHKALEMAYLTKKEAGSEMPIEAFLSVFADSFDKGGADIEDWEGGDPGKIKDQGAALLLLYKDKIMPFVEPQEVEYEFVKVIDNSVPVVGRIDLIDAGLEQFKGVEPDPASPINPAPDIELVDFKTAASRWSADKVENDFQITLYAQMLGIPRTRFDLLVKTKTPYVYQARAIRDAKAGRWAEALVVDVADGINRGYFPRCAPDTWRCRPGKCPAWNLCRGAGK